MAAKKTTKKTSKKKSSGWGGARPGAGRKPGPDSGMRHRARAPHDGRRPLLVTMDRVKGMPSLRSLRLLRVVESAIAASAQSDAGSQGFRVVRFTVDAARLALVVEADNELTLSRGVRSVCIRVARRVNAALGRHGHVWADRYRLHPVR